MSGVPLPFVHPGGPHPGPLPLLSGVLGERGKFHPHPSHISASCPSQFRENRLNRIFRGLRAQRELGIIYFSWHANRVARWRACKYYANIAQIRTEGVAESRRRLGRDRSFTIVPGK